MTEILVTELELERLGIAFEVLKCCKRHIKGWNIYTEVTGTYLKIQQYFFLSFYWNALISVQIWSGVTKHNPRSVTTFSRLHQSIKKIPVLVNTCCSLPPKPEVWVPDLENGAGFSVMRPYLAVCSGEAFCCFSWLFKLLSSFEEQDKNAAVLQHFCDFLQQLIVMLV